MPHEDFVPDRPIHASDLRQMLSRRKWMIFSFSLLGMLALAFWALTRPVLYQAQASFQEKGIQGGTNSTLAGLFGMFSGSAPSGSDTIPLMQSMRLLSPLVEQHQLQATLTEVKPGLSIWRKMTANFAIERAYFGDKLEPLFDAQQLPIRVIALDYPLETPTSLTLRFIDNGNFEIYSFEPLKVTKGALDQPFQTADYSVTLARVQDEPLAGRSFALTLNPLTKATKDFATMLHLKPEEKSEKIVKISLLFPDRHEVSELVNDLMSLYQQHLKAEHQTLATAQLAYLQDRRKEAHDNLYNLMSTYATSLTQDLAQSGIIDSEQELERLEEEKSKLRQRLLAIDLELHRVQNNQAEESGYLSTVGASKELPSLIQDTIRNINELKQRRDRLAIALRKGSDQTDAQVQQQLKEQITAIHEIQTDMDQAKQLVAALTTGQALPPPDTLAPGSSQLLKTWYSKIWETDNQRRSGLDPNKDHAWREQKTQFLSYLDNFVRLAIVQQKLIRERLALQQNPGDEFQGVDLTTANNIYVGLTSLLSDTQAEIRQNSFIIDQVQDPAFEVSSLSGVLKDPVSHSIIQHSSAQSMSLKDSTIRTLKEQERIKEELAQDRAFLLFHLRQATQLLKLREDFLQQKIRSIQEVMLDLIQQQVSVSEKHLHEYAKTHIDQLKEEKQFLLNTVQDINHQMSYLPRKWVAEQMIEHQATISGAITEEISKLVETKNISHHLETVQSAPLDYATRPVLPKRPQVMLFALLGLILGAGFGTVVAISIGLCQRTDSPEG